MIQIDLWRNIDVRFREIFKLIPEKAFDGLLIMTVADFLWQPLFRRKFIFSQFCGKGSMKHL